MKKRPNILFLMADELRADVTGFSGNTIVRTPHLDALAAQSTVFDNAYTPAPVCIPARQCITAGQLPTTCNCRRWYEDLPPNYLTFPRLLSQYGYETAACGKLHHVGPDQMQGYTRRLGMETEVVNRYIPNLQESYDVFAKKWTQDQEVARATSGVKTFHIRQDEIAAACAEYFIEQYFVDPFYQRNSPERPLLLTVSFNQPHYPYVAEQELLDYYLPRVKPYYHEPVFDHPFLSKFAVKASEPTLRRATAAYYAMTQTMDGYIGRVLTALTQTGQCLDDWMIIFTSDHGEMLGQHGVWEKQKFFEGSARVPLFIKLPGQKAALRCSKNVSLCDLYATICDAAGITIPDGLDSRSLSGLICGTDTDWNNEAISIHDAVNLMIKYDALKYQYYQPDDSEILFDLAADPSERQNRIHLAQYADFIAHCRRRAADFGFHPNAN